MPDPIPPAPKDHLKDKPVRTNRRYGWKPDLPDPRDRKYSAPRPVLLNLPPKIDLRTSTHMSPPFDQGALSSCVGNAVAGLVEYVMRNDGYDENFTPSRLFIYFNARDIEGTTEEDSGAMIRDGIRGLVVYGFPPESEWPYDDGPDTFRRRPDDKCYQTALKELGSHPVKISQSLNQIKACLAQGRPVVFGFSVFTSFESEEVARTGVMPIPLPSERCLGGHAVLMVGYDDARQCFIVRNSWGQTWGDKGHFYMPFAVATDPDLASDFWSVTSVP